LTHSTIQRKEVVVIGGGQAGLAIGWFLREQGRQFTILEAGDSPGAVWRGRWDSLRLFTPARYDALPGLAFPGDPDRYPTRDEVADYLAGYARRFDLPVEPDSRVLAVRRSNGGYLVELDDRAYEADQVVIATGPFQTPFVPALAEQVADELVQMHSTAYRSPASLPEGRVLVVGGGNTGFQIAEELSASREVHLSIGSRQTPLPQRILGRDLFWYLDRTGLLRKTTESRLGRRMSGRDTLIGSSPPPRAPARRDRLARPLLPGPVLAAHPRLRPSGLGQGRRRAHRAADRLIPPRAGGSAGACKHQLKPAGEQHEHDSRPVPNRCHRPSKGPLDRAGRALGRCGARAAHRPGGEADRRADRPDARLQRLDPGPGPPRARGL
jgi:cation diffusion facilitator CzcD-associated flavoprotein CzcO